MFICCSACSSRYSVHMTLLSRKKAKFLFFLSLCCVVVTSSRRRKSERERVFVCICVCVVSSSLSCVHMHTRSDQRRVICEGNYDFRRGQQQQASSSIPLYKYTFFAHASLRIKMCYVGSYIIKKACRKLSSIHGRKVKCNVWRKDLLFLIFQAEYYHRSFIQKCVQRDLSYHIICTRVCAECEYRYTIIKKQVHKKCRTFSLGSWQ